MKANVGGNDVNVFDIVYAKMLVQVRNAKPVNLLHQSDYVEHTIIVQLSSPAFRWPSSVSVFIPTDRLPQRAIGRDLCFPRSEVFRETRMKTCQYKGVCWDLRLRVATIRKLRVALGTTPKRRNHYGERNQLAAIDTVGGSVNRFHDGRTRCDLYVR